MSEEKTFIVSAELSTGEMWAIVAALNYFMYNNPNISEEQFNLASSALDKVAE